MKAKMVVPLVVIGVQALAKVAWAGGLGIPLDSFIGVFGTFVIGLGFTVGLVGLLGYAAAQMNNTFGHMLGGSVSFFTNAGLLGGGTTLLGLLGLTAGGLLP